MTTLAAGSSTTVSLKDGGVCTISTNGGQASVTVTPIAGVAYTCPIGPLPYRGSHGPFSEGAKVVISNQNAILDYDIPGGNVVTYVSDPVTGGIDIYADSTPLNIIAVYQSAVPIVSPLDTVNNVLLQVAIPGGRMGKNGRLQIRMLWSYTNNANVKTIKVRFGSVVYAYNAGLASQASANIVVDIMNRGMAASQILTPSNANGTLAHSTQPFNVSAVDTDLSQLVTIECQKATGTDSAVLEAVFVEICK